MQEKHRINKRETEGFIMEISSREVAELVKKVLANMNGDVAKAGANVLVAGSAIFGSEDPKETISLLREKAAKYF